MYRVVVRRALAAVPLIVLISIATFSLALLLPGDPATAVAGPDATAEQLAQARKDLRLDESPPARYVHWVGDVARGDLGRSVRSHRSVAEELRRRLPVTATLAGLALLFALVVGIPLGIIQGSYPGRAVDRVLLTVVSLGLSTPNFWLATLFVAFFAVRLGWLPALGYVPFSASPAEWFRHLVMPTLTLGIFAAAEVARQLRTGLVGVLDADYIRAARARGLSDVRVIGKHALKNAAMPTLTIVGLRIGQLFAGSIIIEQIFGIPGIGQYTLEAIQNRDAPVIQAVVLGTAAIVVAVSLLVDIAYAALNPKVRVA